jgi:ankyrin
LNEGEALAARILELGPQNNRFLGPVIIEIPHYASLRGKEREIFILRNDNGEKWVEHPIASTDTAIEEALGCPIEHSLMAEGPSSGNNGDESNGESQKRLTRIITNDFPKYFALVTRIKQEVHAVNEFGGMISSTVVPKAQAVFPEKALQKKIKLSLQAMPIPQEMVAKHLGTRVAVSPIVTIEPRRRKFHKAITLTIPLPRLSHKTQANSENLRLLCSITGGYSLAQWEDITGHTPLSYVDECASFTTTVSARFWLMDCQNYNDATRMASELYREAIAVPFISRFIVYAKRHEVNEAKMRIFCITDDKEEKTLEKRENFHLIAKTKEIEVLENHVQWLDVSGNLVPTTKSDSLNEQLNFTFQAFKENRLPFVLRIKDLEQHESGRLQLFNDPKSFVPKADVQKQAVCTLDIVLPVYNKVRI